MISSELEGSSQLLKYMGFQEDMETLNEIKKKYYKLYFKLKKKKAILFRIISGRANVLIVWSLVRSQEGSFYKYPYKTFSVKMDSKEIDLYGKHTQKK